MNLFLPKRSPSDEYALIIWNWTKATQKDHIPLPFIALMFEMLARNSFFFYLDGYSGFF